MKTRTRIIATAMIVFCFCSAIFTASAAAQTADDIVKIGVSFDNELNSGTPDAVKYSAPYIDIGVSSTYGPEVMRYIGKVDLGSLDTTREMDSASFKIDRASDSWDQQGFSYSLYEVTENWNSMEVNWNNQPLTSARMQTGVFSSDGLLIFDTTDLVKFWINNPSANHGFIVRKTEETNIIGNDYGLFASADYPEAGAEIRPYVEIKYKSDEMNPITDLAVQAKDTKVQLVWTPVPEAASYDIYRKDPEMADFTAIATGHVSSYATYLDDSPKNGGVYAYMVRWTSVSGEKSPDSNYASATISSYQAVFAWIEPKSVYSVFNLNGIRTVGGVRSAIYPASVETSTDGISWTNVAYSVSSSQQEFTEILFNEPISAQYIRVSQEPVASSVYAMRGDFNGDGIICRNDLEILMQYRNKPAGEFPEADFDGDGMITVLDARKLVLMCTNPRCAC